MRGREERGETEREGERGGETERVREREVGDRYVLGEGEGLGGEEGGVSLHG